jgi:integrase
MGAAQAREIALAKLPNINHGIAPHMERIEAAKAAEAERERARDAFGVLGQAFLAHKATVLRERSLVEVRRYIEKTWAPFNRLPVYEITQRMIAERLAQITQAGSPMAANKARAWLSAFFVWAMQEGITDRNPVAMTRQNEETPRERPLSIEELRAVWAGCRDDDHGRIIRLLILCGSRCEEIGGMRWSELDGTKWTLPAERAKNHQKNTLALAQPALNLLPSRREGDLVFGAGKNGFNNWGQAKKALDDRIEAMTGKRLAPWVAHDLRHSFSTHLHELGVQPHVVETIINHKSGHKAGVAGRYNHAIYENEVREALRLWADHITGAGVVVPMRRVG